MAGLMSHNSSLKKPIGIKPTVTGSSTNNLLQQLNQDMQRSTSNNLN